MELQLFIYKNIALHLYYSKDSIKHGKINVENIFIYFPGLPQIVDENFFAEKINKDTAFFSVYYSGSWLSGGSFTYENCKKTVEIAIKFVKSKKGVKTLDNKQIFWDYKKLHLIGYSFSGNPIISAKISKKDVKNVILFTPLLFLHKKDVSECLKDEKTINNFYSFSLLYLGFLKRGYKFAFRGIERQSWNKYFSGKDPRSFIKINKDYPKVICKNS